MAQERLEVVVPEPCIDSPMPLTISAVRGCTDDLQLRGLSSLFACLNNSGQGHQGPNHARHVHRKEETMVDAVSNLTTKTTAILWAGLL